MPSYRCVLLWLLLLWPGLAWSQRADLFSAAELAWIKTHPVVRVAVAPNWPPVEYLEGYVHKGLTAEYLAAITRLSGLRFAAVSCENWSIARSALQEGRVELLPAISAELASSALREQIAFSRPYFAGSTLVVTQAATSVIFDPRQLAGKTVAVKGDGAYERTLRERYPGITILPTASPAESLERVARGQADAAIDMDAALLPVLQRRYFDTLHVAGVIVSMPAVLSMGVRADNPLLQAILDKSLAALTAQETDRMVARWLESSEHGLPSWSLLLHHYKWQALAALLVLFSVGMLGYRAFRARQRAEQSEREKSMFLAVMSHEIRTPMHAILASVELLARGRLPAEEARLAQVAVSSSVALLELLDDVLDFSKMEANQLSLECAPTNLRMLLREAVAIADARAADKHLPLSLVLPPSSNEWPVIDAHRVRQILNNLLSNAIKFTERGQVELSARLEPASSGTQRANLSICVSDTGIGISRRQQARLFKAFSQADHSTTRRFGGTGLGLTICHDLVKLMQGSIRVDSEPGKGTRVLVELPVQLAPAIDQSHPAASQVEHSPESKSLQVLVVEDHPVNQFVIERQL
jgi:two-component system sensor histidine kinase EvgS